LREEKALKNVDKCWNGNLSTMLCKQFCLYFVQIHAVVSRDESLDEDDVCFCENVRVTNMPTRMWVIGDSIVMVIHKALIHKALADAKDTTDFFYRIVELVAKYGDVCLDVSGYELCRHVAGSQQQTNIQCQIFYFLFHITMKHTVTQQFSVCDISCTSFK
jgi:hypothetical protein